MSKDARVARWELAQAINVHLQRTKQRDARLADGTIDWVRHLNLLCMNALGAAMAPTYKTKLCTPDAPCCSSGTKCSIHAPCRTWRCTVCVYFSHRGFWHAWKKPTRTFACMNVCVYSEDEAKHRAARSAYEWIEQCVELEAARHLRDRMFITERVLFECAVITAIAIGVSLLAASAGCIVARRRLGSLVGFVPVLVLVWYLWTYKKRAFAAYKRAWTSYIETDENPGK